MPITRADADSILANFDIPDRIVGTKLQGSLREWSVGEERRLTDNVWLLDDLVDARLVTDRQCAISMETNIAKGGVLLSCDELTGDALTKRIFCLALLSGSAGGARVAVSGIATLCNNLDWITRWRLSLGTPANSQLTRKHLRAFVRLVSKPDLIDLVGGAGRVDELYEALAIAPKTGAHEVTEHENRPFHRLILDVASQLGVTVKAVRHSLWLKGVSLTKADVREVRSASNGQMQNAPLRVKQRDCRSSYGVYTFLRPWVILSELSIRGALAHDPLNFEPFPDQQPYRVALKFGFSTGRMGGFAPDEFLALLNAAAKWVGEYSSHVLTAVEVLQSDPVFGRKGRVSPPRLQRSLEMDALLPDGMPRLWLGWNARGSSLGPSGDRRITISAAILYTMTACFILIGGFAALEPAVVLNLKTGCVTQPKRGLFELSAQSETRLRALDSIPVPALVAIAVEVLTILSTSARVETGKEWLFRVRRGGPERMLAIPRHSFIREFAEVSGLVTPDDATSFYWDGRQLARGFAVAHHLGYQAGSLDALSAMLGQFDPELTRYHVYRILAGNIGEVQERILARQKAFRISRGEELKAQIEEDRRLLKGLKARQAMFDEVRCEAVALRLLPVMLGQERPFGKGGARLTSELAALAHMVRSEVRIGSQANDPDNLREPFQESLLRFAKTHFVDRVPGGAVHCTCRPGNPDDLRTAACLIEKAQAGAPWGEQESSPHEDELPDFAWASTLRCLGCVHGAAFRVDEPLIEARCSRLREVANTGSSEAVRADAERLHQEHLAAVTAARAAVGVRE